MSDRGSDQTEAVVPFAPKLNPRSDLSDPLGKAGHLILDMVRQASGNARASYQQAAEMSRKLSAQLRSAEAESESLRQNSGTTRTGRIEPSDGCVQPRQGGHHAPFPKARMTITGCMRKPAPQLPK